MPLAKGSKNITIRVGLMKRLENKHKDDLRTRQSTDKTLIGYVNKIIEGVIEKDEFLKFYFPSISVIGILENKLYLRDKELGRSIGVYPINGKLYCDTDDTFECKHIHYIFALPEIAYLKWDNQNQNKFASSIGDEKLENKSEYESPPDVIRELKELFPEITDDDLLRLAKERPFIESFFLGVNSFKKAYDRIHKS